MTDSLDMLLNMRQPSAGRRAVPPPAASPARSPSRGDYGGSSSASGGSGVGSSFSYGGASRPSVSTASLAPYASQGQRKDSGYGSSSTPTHPSRVGSASASGSASGLSASPSFDRPAHSPSASPKGNADAYAYGHAYGSNHNDNARSGYQQQQQAQSQQSQQSQPQSHYSEPASPVNWGHFKAVAAKQRVGSAHASQTAGASNGPNHAAAGLSDAYVSSQQRAAPAAAAPASPSPSQPSALHTRDANKRADSDSTVIGGAVIFPLKAAPRVDTAGAAAAPSTSGGLTPLKRNPFASPTAASAAAAAAPNASPFATATSGFTRPAPLGSPTAAASGGADGAGAGSAVRAVQTFSCPDCGRSFKRGSLMKHQKVCKKVFKQKREQFDSAKVRTQGLTQGDDEESQWPNTHTLAW